MLCSWAFLGLLANASSLDYKSSARDALGLRFIVRNPQNSNPGLYAARDQRFDRRLRSRIESRGGLIEQQYLRSHHESANKGESQPLAGRQSRDRPGSGLLRQPQLSKTSGRRLPVVKMFSDRFGPPAWFRRHITDQAAPQGCGNCRTITAVQGYRALIGIEVRDGTQQQ